jgi:hypothetical protein
MGIQHSDGYSANIEAFLVVGERRISVAKTGHDSVVLIEPCDLTPGTTGELEIIVDGDRASQAVVLDEGAVSDRRKVSYSVAEPF